MSEKMLRIPLEDLKTVRLKHTCGHGVVEVPTEQLSRALNRGACRLCGKDVILDTETDHLNALRIAIGELLKIKDITIEFEIPAGDK